MSLDNDILLIGGAKVGSGTTKLRMEVMICLKWNCSSMIGKASGCKPSEDVIFFNNLFKLDNRSSAKFFLSYSKSHTRI